MRRVFREWLSIPLGPALLAAAVSVVAAFVMRLFLRILSPAELFGDRITVLIPLPLFAALLDTFGSNAKHLFFAGLLVAEAVLTALGGVLYWNARRLIAVRQAEASAGVLDDATASNGPAGHAPVPVLGYLETPLLALALYLVALLALAPLIGGGFLGTNLEGGVGGSLLALLAPVMVFALAFVTLLRGDVLARRSAAVGTAAGERAGADMRWSRRRLLGEGLFAAALLGGAAVAWEFITAGLGTSLGIRLAPQRAPHVQIGDTPARIVPPPQPVYGPWTAVDGLTDEVTSNDSFYYVSKNLGGDPETDGTRWTLTIGGHVAHPFSLSYADLKALPSEQRYHTLECISNWVGGPLMSNALFTGTRLADLLNRAGIQPGASELIFRAADDYSDSLHLSQALDPRSLVVYELNGEPLPQAHGFPARLLIPGLYGMKNGKWLTSLTIGSGSYTGYWEQQGWTREALVKTMTRIDVPADGDIVPARPTFIAGVAFAADRGIARVDVSTDGGATWQAATLRQPLGALTWVLWELPWQPSAGAYYLVARAIDLDGNVQTPAEADPLPDGASGYHVVHVIVR
jgi:DMSO/TMAO reductase YedYZ molybdopterin-dependent catalytic subunit